MFIVSEFLRNPGLFMVFSNTHDTIGKPVEWCVMNKRSDAPNRIMKGEKWVMEIPWHETRGTEEPFVFENLIHFFQHFFMGLDQKYLAKGCYYTKFTQIFCLGRHHDSPEYIKEPVVCTDTLILKINFKIK